MTLLVTLDTPGLLGPEAARLYQQIGPMVTDDADNGWAAAHLCAVLTAPVERLTRISSDDGEKPGWGVCLDVDEADAQDLPWLGQFDGTPVDTSLPIDEQRRHIREARGSHRGKIRALQSDITAMLTGERFCNILERTGGKCIHTIVLRPEEVPLEAAPLTVINNRATKPLGVIYNLVITDIWIIAEVERQYDTIAEFEAAFETVHQAETRRPE